MGELLVTWLMFMLLVPLDHISPFATKKESHILIFVQHDLRVGEESNKCSYPMDIQEVGSSFTTKRIGWLFQIV